jgi:hypothetical protein
VCLQLYAEAEKQQKMAKRKDYYKILGVDQTASTRDVKKVGVGLLLHKHDTSTCVHPWRQRVGRHVQGGAMRQLLSFAITEARTLRTCMQPIWAHSS